MTVSPRTLSLKDNEPLTRSLVEQMALRLSDRILEGHYHPGQRIFEQTIADEFQVSRGPVRECLRLLEKDGLITLVARHGAQVTKLSIEEVKEIFDIRAPLNGLRDRMLAEDPRRELWLPELKKIVAELSLLACSTQSADRYVACVAKLNHQLGVWVSNQRLKNILASLARQTRRYSQLGLSTPARRQQSIEHWQKMVEAIEKGDGDTAQSIACQRVYDSRDAAIHILQNQPASASNDSPTEIKQDLEAREA